MLAVTSKTGTQHDFATLRFLDRRRIIESATSSEMNRFSHKFAEAINSCGGNSLAQRKNRLRASASRFEKLREDFRKNWQKGKCSVLDHFDFDQVLQETLSDNDRAAILARDGQYQHQRIAENVSHALTSDWVSHLLVDSIRYGIIERAEIQPTIHLQMVDRNIRLVPGSSNKLVKFRTEADVVEDNLAEEEQTSRYQPAPPILVTLPKPRKKKFSMGFTREALTVAPNNILRQEIDRHGNSMDLHIEKLIIDLLWGLYDHTTPGSNPTPYIESDVEIHPFQTLGAAGPWENQLFDNDLDGTPAPFGAIESIVEDRRDPYSGEPVTYGEQAKMIVTTREQMRQAAQGLGVTQLGQDLGGPANKRQAVEIPSGQYDVTSADIVQSAFAKDRLTAWYQTAAGGSKTATAAKTAAEATWLYTDPRRSACFATEWEREKITREGTGTSAYFENEVIYEAKWMEKSTAGWKDPQFTIRNRKT